MRSRGMTIVLAIDISITRRAGEAPLRRPRPGPNHAASVPTALPYKGLTTLACGYPNGKGLGVRLVTCYWLLVARFRSDERRGRRVRFSGRVSSRARETRPLKRCR